MEKQCSSNILSMKTFLLLVVVAAAAAAPHGDHDEHEEHGGHELEKREAEPGHVRRIWWL